ncbi:hypothetical protein AB6E21_16230 [Photobacterium swingsii]|uniref:hypothetical protein n=1 Tax=Photobacterium swingsii TaxID=680026 RepID=UPI003550861E
MKTKLILLACLLAAPLVQAETATIKFDHIEGSYAFFSNTPKFMTSGGSYSFVPYFNEGWPVLANGTVSHVKGYILSTRNSSWTTVKQGKFSFDYKLAYMGVKVQDLKTDMFNHGRLTTIGCAARTKDGQEEGEAGNVFNSANASGKSLEYQRYWSLAKNRGSTYYIACNPANVSNYNAIKHTKVTESYLAFQFRVNTKNAALLPDKVIIPASSHLIQPYAENSDRSMLAGRDITFYIDKTKYPTVFDVKRTPQSDITIHYNRVRDAGKTIQKETLFKIDMMVGAWWSGHLSITPSCQGDQYLCGSISNIAIQSVAANRNTTYHDTMLNNVVKMKNIAPSTQINDQDWKIKVDFSNLDRIPVTQSKRKAQIHYNIEASI